MSRRHIGRLALIIVGAAALLLGVQFGGRAPTDSSETTVSRPVPAAASVALTDLESEWCEAHAGRVAGVAYWEYRTEGAPALYESERTTGSLRPETFDALLAWQAERPELYDKACRSAFEAWAGRE